MRRRLYSVLFPAAALAAVITAAACGSVATPEWASDAQATQAALAATSQQLTASAPTLTPTNTALPPTATNTALPTATIAATNTPAPTEAPTEAPTAAPTEAPAQAAGDPEAGQTVFTTSHTLPDGAQWACASCHSVSPDEMVLIGPGLYNVSVRAQTYDVNQTPEEYIHNSIVNPQDFIAPHPAGGQWPLPMPHGFGDVLSEDEINNVVAYLMTLHD